MRRLQSRLHFLLLKAPNRLALSTTASPELVAVFFFNNGISNTILVTLETPWQRVIGGGTAWLN